MCQRLEQTHQACYARCDIVTPWFLESAVHGLRQWLQGLFIKVRSNQIAHIRCRVDHDVPKANCLEWCIDGSRRGCSRVIEDLGNAMELGFRHIASNASWQGNNQTNADGLQYHALSSRIVSLLLPLIWCAAMKLNKLPTNEFAKVLPPESISSKLNAMKKATSVNNALAAPTNSDRMNAALMTFLPCQMCLIPPDLSPLIHPQIF
jgi:hypothetical protein